MVLLDYSIKTGGFYNYGSSYSEGTSSSCTGIKSATVSVKYQVYDTDYTIGYGLDNSASSSITTTGVKCFDWCNSATDRLFWGYKVTQGFNTWSYVQGERVPEKPLEDRISEIIRNRVSPAVITRRKGVDHTDDIREMRARETLRRVVGDQKFFMFLKKGFITVPAKSGLIYQISPGHGITNVWDSGKLVERLCVVLRGEFPPTDSLIMRYLMVLNNEDQFRSLAVKHTVLSEHQPGHVEPKVNGLQPSLVDLFRDLKKRHGRIAA